MKKKGLILCLLSLFLAMVFACTEDNSGTNAPEGLSTEIAQAKAFFDNTVGGVALPDRTRIFGGAATRSGQTAVTAVSEPQWASASVYRDGEVKIVQVPLQQNKPVTALVRQFDMQGGLVHNKKQVIAWLLIGESADGTTKTLTATVIAGKRYRMPADASHPIHATHDLRGTDFTGLVLYSTPEGRLVFGAEYVEGAVVNRLLPSAIETGHRHGHDEDSSHDHHAVPQVCAFADDLSQAPGPTLWAPEATAPETIASPVAVLSIELIDSSTATPTYVMSWEDPWGDDPSWVCTGCFNPTCNGACQYPCTLCWDENCIPKGSCLPIPIPSYRIAFDLNGASGIPPSTQYINTGKYITQPQTPVCGGHDFGGWYTSSNCAGSPVDFSSYAVSSNLTLYAKWIPRANVSTRFDYTITSYLPEELTDIHIEVYGRILNQNYQFVSSYPRDIPSGAVPADYLGNTISLPPGAVISNLTLRVTANGNPGYLTRIDVISGIHGYMGQNIGDIGGGGSIVVSLPELTVPARGRMGTEIFFSVD